MNPAQELALRKAIKAGDKQKELQIRKAIAGVKSKDKPVDFSVTEMVKNIPDSAYQYGKDVISGIGQMVSSPIETAGALGNVAAGFVQKYHPDAADKSKVPYAEAMQDFYKKRYGSWDKSKQTAMDDPVGVLSDVAMVPSVAGMGVKGVGLLAHAPKVTKAGTAMTTAGAALDPLNLAWNTTVRPVGRAAGQFLINTDTPGEIWARGARLPVAATHEDVLERARIGNIALKAGVRPTIKGAKKLRELIKDSSKKVDEFIIKATQEGKKVTRDSLFKYWDNLIDEWGSHYLLEGSSDRRILTAMKNKYYDDFDKFSQGKDYLTPKQAQHFKRNLYKKLNPNVWNQKTTDVHVAGRKAASISAKEELEKIAPGIDAANQQLGDYLALQDAIPEVTTRLANVSPLSTGSLLRVGAGGHIARELLGQAAKLPGMGIGAASMAINTPSVKFRIAEDLYKILNSPVIDLRTKHKALAHLRQLASEIEQTGVATPTP